MPHPPWVGRRTLSAKRFTARPCGAKFMRPGLDAPPGMMCFENSREASPPFTERENLVRHFLEIRQALGDNESGNIQGVPGTGSPADSPAEDTSDTAPLLQTSQSGAFCPGALRPLRGMPFKENGRGQYLFVVAEIYLLRIPAKNSSAHLNSYYSVSG